MDNRGLPALPGLKSTYWNIRSSNSAGTPYAQVESDAAIGKLLHFHVPANYQATDGEATAGASRVEQEPNVANFGAGDVRWIGFWFKVGAAEASSTTHPGWNVALQLANGVGSPRSGWRRSPGMRPRASPSTAPPGLPDSRVTRSAVTTGRSGTSSSSA